MSRAKFVLAMALIHGPATAGVPEPDPSRSTVPPYLYVVGKLSQSAMPDPFGAATVTVRDAFGNPFPGTRVVLDFSPCCDIVLCPSGEGHDCVARTVTGITNAQGQVTFHVIGAGRDPGSATPPCQKEGCREEGIRVFANSGTGDVLIARPRAVVLDQNGGAGGSNGTTGSDIAALIQLFGSVSLGSPYRARGDIDASGHISGADVAAMIAHFGRLSAFPGTGCPTSFCVQPDCRPAFGPGACGP